MKNKKKIKKLKKKIKELESKLPNPTIRKIGFDYLYEDDNEYEEEGY